MNKILQLFCNFEKLMVPFRAKMLYNMFRYQHPERPEEGLTVHGELCSELLLHC